MDKQTAKFVARVLENLPEMDSHLMQSWIENPKSLQRALKEALCPPMEIEPVKYVVDLDCDPFIPPRWALQYHIKGGQFKWNTRKIELYLAEEQKSGIHGAELRCKLQHQTVFNANLLDFLLRNPHLIPESWKGKAIFFWGTVYRNASDNYCVRYFDWDGASWSGHNCLLERSWDSDSPAAVMKKQ